MTKPTNMCFVNSGGLQVSNASDGEELYEVSRELEVKLLVAGLGKRLYLNRSVGC